jgi:hypothetical protein
MKITLSELRQFIKNVIKENLLSEANNPPMGGATDIFIDNGYEVLKSNNQPEMSSIELKKDNNTVVMKRSNNLANTIQVNGGKTTNFSTINDREFKLAVMMLGLEGLPK